MQLPLDQRHIAERRVQPTDVVVALDPRGDGGRSIDAGGEPVAMDELPLEARPERFGYRVGEAGGHPAGGLADLVPAAERSEPVR